MAEHHGHAHGLTADVSVRPSFAEDAPHLGRIQVASWRTGLAGVLPAEVLEGMDAEQFAAAWGAAIDSPPSAKHRMLTACHGVQIVGFAALAPAPQTQETGEIVALEVDPEHARAGHGSRLLAACTDLLRATNASHVRAWAIEGDEARAAFLSTAGLEPLGIRRVLDVAGSQVNELAFSAVLS